MTRYRAWLIVGVLTVEIVAGRKRAAADAVAPSPNVPAPRLRMDDAQALETRIVWLKSVRADEARTIILGTVGAGTLKIQSNAQNGSLTLTDTPERIHWLIKLITALDKPSIESDIQRRLYEMWIRMNDVTARAEKDAP